MPTEVMCLATHAPLADSFPVSIPHSPAGISWNHLPHKLPSPRLRVCLWGNQLRSTSCHIIALLKTLRGFLVALGINSNLLM